jgi:hypothetical protein
VGFELNEKSVFYLKFSINPKINGILAPKPRAAAKRSDSVNSINSNQPKWKNIQYL